MSIRKKYDFIVFLKKYYYKYTNYTESYVIVQTIHVWTTFLCIALMHLASRAKKGGHFLLSNNYKSIHLIVPDIIK